MSFGLSSSYWQQSVRAIAAVAASSLIPAVAAAQVEVARFVGQSLSGEYGRALATVGDVDGDGIEDFLIAEPRGRSSSGATLAGRVELVSGATLAVIRTHEGAAADELGGAIAGLGDVDLDGVPDYALAAPGHYVGSLNGAGQVNAFSGASGALLWTVDGAAMFERFGSQITAISDMDADGRPELLALSTLSEATIVSGIGVKGSVLNTLGITLSSIGRAGDLDGDGFDEILVGSHRYTGTYAQEGIVLVFAGATGLQVSSFGGTRTDHGIGYRVLGIDDIDQDGVRDILVSGGIDTSPTIGDGVVQVRSGATLATIAAKKGGNSEVLGRNLASLGDWDHDGVGDWAASTGFGYPDIGSVRIFSGRTVKLVHEIAGQYDLNFEHAHDFGQAMCAGDWNGDGDDDLAVGAWMWHDADFEFEGAAFVYLGCPAFSQSYGAGWAGTLGTPTLAAGNDPVVGQPLTLTASNSLGAATLGLLLVGLDDANLTLPSGATLLVDQPLVLPLAIPAAGFVLTGTLPDDPSLYFAHVYVQLLESDPGAVGRLSFTQGVDLRCGFDL